MHDGTDPARCSRARDAGSPPLPGAPGQDLEEWARFARQAWWYHGVARKPRPAQDEAFLLSGRLDMFMDLKLGTETVEVFRVNQPAGAGSY